MPHNLDMKVNDITHHDDGRLIILDCTLEGNNFILVNIYAPTKDKTHMQNGFLSYLNSVVDDYGDNNIIIGGDFDVCLDPLVDKFGGRA